VQPLSPPDGTTHWIIPLVIAAVSFLGALGGTLLGGWMNARREKTQRRVAFLERQLRDLYSPLLELRAEVRAHGELRLRVDNAADLVWRDLCAKASDEGGNEGLRKLHEERWPQFEALLEYDNSKLRDDLMPAYRQMALVFRDNLGLAEPETRAYFESVLEYVEIWERYLTGEFPPEVIKELGHSEARLAPFYAHLELQHARLRAALVSGDPNKFKSGGEPEYGQVN